MRAVPIEVIASWPTPDYISPETRGPGLIILNSVLIIILTVVVLLRLYVRVHMLKWFGIDDLFIIVALTSAMGLAACVILANVSYGWDRHIWDLPLVMLPGALKIAWAAKIVYSSAAGFTRLSLLFFYYRLVQDSHMRWFRNMIHFSIFVSISTMLALIFLTIFQCRPIRAFWTYSMQDAHCLDEGWLTLGCGIANTIADLLIILLPVPLIAKLDLPPRRRFGAIILVSFGLVVCIAGSIRAYYTWLSLINSFDETWDCYGVWISAAIEIDLGVLCACAPALRLIFVKVCGPHLANLSSQLTTFSPFPSKQSKTMESSGSDARPLHLTTETSLEREGTVLREKGFIITRGFGTRSSQKESSTAHLWDEPWTGDNGPGPTNETIGSQERPQIAELDATTPSLTKLMAELDTATPVSIVRMSSTNIKPVITRRSEIKTGKQVVPTIGVLPDASTVNDTEPEEEEDDSDENVDLIIQKPQTTETHLESIGFPSIIARPGFRQRTGQASWIDLDVDTDTERPSRSRPAASDKKRSSWLDDRSHDSIEEGGPPQNFGVPSSVTTETIGRERVRSWNYWRRADELGWDLGNQGT